MRSCHVNELEIGVVFLCTSGSWWCFLRALCLTLRPYSSSSSSATSRRPRRVSATTPESQDPFKQATFVTRFTGLHLHLHLKCKSLSLMKCQICWLKHNRTHFVLCCVHIPFSLWIPDVMTSMVMAMKRQRFSVTPWNGTSTWARLCIDKAFRKPDTGTQTYSTCSHAGMRYEEDRVDLSVNEC